MPNRLWLQLFIKNYLLLVAKDCTIDDLNIKQPNESSHFISNNSFFFQIISHMLHKESIYTTENIFVHVRLVLSRYLPDT